MTRNDSGPDRIVDSESRRGILTKGALALGGVAGIAGITGGAGAVQEQDNESDSSGIDPVDPAGPEQGDPDFLQDETYECLMYQQDFQSAGEFIITSPVIDWTPGIAFGESLETSYNSRMIRYRSGELATLFVAQGAELPPFNDRLGYVVDPDEEFGPNEFAQPQVYALAQGVLDKEHDMQITGAFRPVEEDYEEALLQTRAFGLRRRLTTQGSETTQENTTMQGNSTSQGNTSR